MFDIVVVGGGSAGAVIASRLSEDPSVKVALLEAGGPPPPEELMPAACPALQLNPETDWMWTGDPGNAGEGLVENRMMVPRGKMLGGSSGINYMAYVRGHPGDFDEWEAGGASGWSYDDVLPLFKRSEGLQPSGDIVVDPEAHNPDGPLGVSVRTPVLRGGSEFVQAANATGIPSGDYNGRDRGGPQGVASLFQTTTKDGKRSSTFHAFLEGVMDERDNLTVITHAHARRVLLEGDGDARRAVGVEYTDADGAIQTAMAAKEVIVSAGAYGSPQLLMLSGIGPRDVIEGVGLDCQVDLPDVGRHLKDHLHVPMFFPAPGIGTSMLEVGMGMGSDALRAPAGPLPADPADDDGLPPELAGLKAEADRRLAEWATTGRGVVASSLYDAGAWFSTGLGEDEHTHDAQIGCFVCGYNPDIWQGLLRIDPQEYFDDVDSRLDPQAESILMLPNPVRPRSEGQVTLASADPGDTPVIDLNYFDDPHDLPVMVSVMRKVLEIADNWPDKGVGSIMLPAKIAQQHGWSEGDELTDEILEDFARNYAITVYHPTSTCRIGEVLDPALKVYGVSGLRVADASVMPDIVSGNTNAACIMIGEKAADLVAGEHGITLQA